MNAVYQPKTVLLKPLQSGNSLNNLDEETVQKMLFQRSEQ